jgi:hypothetical protein
VRGKNGALAEIGSKFGNLCMISIPMVDIPVVVQIHKWTGRIIGEQRASGQIGRNGCAAARALFELYHYNAVTSYQIKGPNCGRFAIKRHTMMFDAMNRGYSETPLPHSRPKEWNLSHCVKKVVLGVLLLPMINSFTILSIVPFHNLLVCCPCSRQVKAQKWLRTSACYFGRDLPLGQC